MYKLILWPVVLPALCFLSFAEIPSHVDAAVAFGKSHGCSPTEPLKSTADYISWVDFSQGVLTGAIEPTIFSDCPQSPYLVYTEIFENKIDPSIHVDARKKLLALTNNSEERTLAGFGAAEYLIFNYILCQADFSCFSNAMDEDGYWSAACPDEQSGSPDIFELNLFKHGGDMRYFLPYAVTNCRIMSGAEDKDEYIYRIIDEVLNSPNGL
ncbi:MAG: hypothetical protein Q4G26_06360 [Paracoccus sp. (in: a-proteobacteria)]|nr:hypothetical protein [Paracoccus sp. (in: a-proteobacteria)]